MRRSAIRITRRAITAIFDISESSPTPASHQVEKDNFTNFDEPDPQLRSNGANSAKRIHEMGERDLSSPQMQAVRRAALTSFNA